MLPGNVARPGSTARYVSRSGLTVSSLRQNEHSSKIASEIVRPRVCRKLFVATVDVHSARELEPQPRLAHDEGFEIRNLLKESLHVPQHNLSLLAIARQALHCRKLARPQSAHVRFLDRRGIRREQRRNAVLARSSAGRDP